METNIVNDDFVHDSNYKRIYIKQRKENNMDYEKKYKEALNIARDYHSKGYMMINIAIENIFPELKESEDDRIKNRLIKLVKMSSEVGGFALHKWEADEMVAWLEKQGEQKPTLCERYENIRKSEWFKKTHEGMSVSDDEESKWTEEDDKRKISVTEYLNELYDDNRFSLNELTDLETWLKSLKQRMEEQQ